MISAKLQGQMGNHLFQYSFLRMVGERNGFEYAFIPTDEPDEYLNMKNWYVNHIFECDVRFTDRKDYSFAYKDINDGTGYDQNNFVSHPLHTIKDDTFCKGIFQSRDVVESIGSDWFRVKIPSKISSFDLDECCFLHFRGDDYYINRAMLDNYELYYASAQKKMNELCGRKMCYIVISDDLPAAKLHVKADQYIKKNAHSDFFTMYNAKYTIIPNSSFSWWASFLSKNRQVCIAPSGWFFYKYGQHVKSDWCYTDKFIWI